jgi:hypothetical protein
MMVSPEPVVFNSYICPRLQDLEPSEVRFDLEVPDEILRKGWERVLVYLQELQAQGGTFVREARVFLLGEGGQGKTSLLRALLDRRDLTDSIKDDDRTVGINVKVLGTWGLTGVRMMGPLGGIILQP